SPNDGIDKRLHLNFDARLHRQVQKLDTRFVHRITQNLVASSEQNGGPKTARKQQQPRTPDQEKRQDEQPGSHAKATQQFAGHEQLRDKCTESCVPGEGTEKRREGILVSYRLFRDCVELPCRGGGDDRRKADESRDRFKVWGLLD